MYRLTLTDDQQRELRRRTHRPGLAPSTRDRLEMVRLSAAGWSIPRIARHLGLHEQTIRAWIKAFLTGGFEALPNQRRGGGQSTLTPALLAAARTMIATSGRTWTARQLAAWFAREYGVRLSTTRIRVHLKRAGLSYHRTSRSLAHKQDAAAVAAFTTEAAAAQKKPKPA